MHTAKDSRLFERIEGELAVRYSPHGSDREFCGTTKDISGGGIRMIFLKKLAPGTTLDLELFKYDTNIKTRCRGKVVWIGHEAMSKEQDEHFEGGIEFVDKGPLNIARLINYLESQNKIKTT